MKTSFGPWTTAIHSGAKAQLSTFWKRRLALLRLTSQSSSAAGRSTIVALSVVALVVVMLPTLSGVRAIARQDELPDAAQRQPALSNTARSSLTSERSEGEGFLALDSQTQNAQTESGNNQEVPQQSGPEHRKAYESAKTLKDALAILQRRLFDANFAEYGALLDEKRVKNAIRNSVMSYEAEHLKVEAAMKKANTPQEQIEFYKQKAKHFREAAKPLYERIVNKGEWPRGAFFVAGGGNTPGISVFQVDLVVETRNADGSGHKIGEAEVTIHGVEVLHVNFGKVNLPDTPTGVFQFDSSRGQ